MTVDGQVPASFRRESLRFSQPKSVLQTLLLRIRFYRLQLIWLLLFCLLQLFLLGMGVLEYVTEYDHYVAIRPPGRPWSDLNLVAYAVGSCIRVNAAVFLLFPAYRYTLGFLRRSFLAGFVPFDSWIRFHMIVGYTTLVCAAIHVGTFVVHFYHNSHRPDAVRANKTIYVYLFKVGTIGSDYLGLTNVSGWVMAGALLVMFLFSLPPVRHSRFFDVFYWTHKLQFVFWAALIIHEPIFWRIFVAPCCLLLVEKSRVYINAFRWAAEPVRIQHVTLLPAQVARITINRPSAFSYNPGDYVFLRIPSLGLLSWHPFTLTSSPENKETISFHVKASGNWTRRLPIRLKAAPGNLDNALKHASLHSSSDKVATLELHDLRPPGDDSDPKGHELHSFTVLLNGPYASSSTYLLRTRHAVLIAGGIGVTPFASVLRNLLSQFKAVAVRDRCPGCGNLAPLVNAVSHPFQYAGRRTPLEAVDFIWVCRDAGALQWFGDLWREWAEVQAGHAETCPHRFMVPHVYITRGMKDGERTVVPVRTGRPDLEGLFSQIVGRSRGGGASVDERRDGVRVFTCGPRQLEDEVREKCILYRLPLSWEVFA